MLSAIALRYFRRIAGANWKFLSVDHLVYIVWSSTRKMSIKITERVNGRTVKRRKLSHDDEIVVQMPIQPVDSSSTHDDEDEGDSSSGNEGVDFGTKSHLGAQHRAQPKTDLHSAGRSQVRVSASSTSPASLALQTSNLLKETTPDYASILKRARRTTDSVISAIKDVPSQPEMSFAEAQSFSQKTLRVTIPWSHRPATGIQYKFSFVTPTKITIDGGLVQQLSAKSDSPTLVLRPEMPDQMFDDKDYLDYRAIHKRAFYLSCIASTMRAKLEKEFEIKFSYANGLDLVPILHIKAQISGKSFVYEINPSFPPSLGRVEKMTPNHNCIRKSNSGDKNEPTPRYNSIVRDLASSDELSKLIQSAAGTARNFRDACRLGDIWLRQRSMSSSVEQGGFGLIEWATLCALLLVSGRQGGALLLPRYNALQFFKGVLQVLSLRDAYDPYVLRGDNKLENSDTPTIYDSVTGVNLLYKMTPWSYGRLKHHATTSLTQLNLKKINAFDATFVSKVSESSLEFEQSYTINLGATEDNTNDIASRMHKILKRGFGDRVTLLSLFTDSSKSWKITSSAPTTKPGSIRIGMLLDSEAALRFVDQGPSVEDKEATKDFRDFWGDKAELRKFKDGTITETLVWSKVSRVLEQIVKYLLQRHFKIQPKDIRSSPYLQKLQLSDFVPADEAFAVVNQKLQSLISTLHHLDGLPLPVRSVNAASDLARSSSLMSPLAPGQVQPINVVIQFDTSGRWPDNLQAIQYTKIAFLTKIGDLLSKHDKSFECNVGLEYIATSGVGTHNTSYLDIVQPAPSPQLPPIVFRLRIYHERELHLVQQALAAKNTLSPQLRDSYQTALQTQKQVMARVNHTIAVISLITAFPALSATIRLLKQFLSVHQLTPHISEEVIEILACNAFLNPAPWSVPGTSTAAFSRCLYFLSRWDWSIEPLIVDLSAGQDMTMPQRQELQTRFHAWRKLDPNMNSVAWFVGTNLDETGVMWTQGVIGNDPKPARVVASRLTALASATVELLKSVDAREDKLMTDEDWAAIFTSSHDDFDFVLNLKESIIGRGRSQHLMNGKFKNLQLASAMDTDTTGIDTVSAYFEELQQSFGSVAIFFHGGKHSDSTAICGLWRPHVRSGSARQLKIRLGMSTMPYHMFDTAEDKADDLCLPNVEGMLCEMARMGQGIVSSVSQKG